MAEKELDAETPEQEKTEEQIEQEAEVLFNEASDELVAERLGEDPPKREPEKPEKEEKPEPEKAEASAEEPEAASTEDKEPEPNWFDTLPEQAKQSVVAMQQQTVTMEEANEQLRNQLGSALGRLKPLQQQAEEKKDPEKAPDAAFSSDEWAKIRKEYPDFAETLEKENKTALEALEGRMEAGLKEQLEDKLGPIQQDRALNEYRQQDALLAEAMPDRDHWKGIIDPATGKPLWKAWVQDFQSISRGNRAMAEQARTDGQTAIELHKLFANYVADSIGKAGLTLNVNEQGYLLDPTIYQLPEKEKEEPAPVTGTAPTRREQELKDTAPITDSPPIIPQGDVDDPEAEFNAVSERLHKERLKQEKLMR